MAALPRALLEKLPPGFAGRLLFRGEPVCGNVALADNALTSDGAGWSSGGDAFERPRVLSSGLKSIDELLPDGGFPKASVIELMVTGTAALGTTLALATCRAVHAGARRDLSALEGPPRERDCGALDPGDAAWCAFVDSSETLHAPGVARAGVNLERLLVVRPPAESLERVALRIVESQAFAVVVIDTVGVPGRRVPALAHGRWPRLVRRCALALEGTESLVLLITDAQARRSLPLPVAMRLELCRSKEQTLSLRVAKERRGRVSSPHTVVWTRPPGAPAGLQGAPEEGEEARPRVRLLA